MSRAARLTIPRNRGVEALHYTPLQQYLELYRKTDVLILADVFENFRGVFMRNLGLDLAHDVSSPQLSLNALLLHTNCALDLTKDPEIRSIVEHPWKGLDDVHSA